MSIIESRRKKEVTPADSPNRTPLKALAFNIATIGSATAGKAVQIQHSFNAIIISKQTALFI
jgi:hypothetical protein